jgi:type I restriction enzyme R subunit
MEHFHDKVAALLDGHAKAMVVTDSRIAAVRYKRAIDKTIKQKGYGYGTLVAFSGTVHDPASGPPDDFTEASMNPGVHDLRTAFRGDEYRVMIVANKFQTGFDQPLLCAMYVDRILTGVTAVQTLSRLNRTYRTPSGVQKTAAMTQVVDFVNQPETIREAFEPYYTDAFLETETDPNLVHDLAAKLDTAGIYTQADIDKAAHAVLTGNHGELSGAIEQGKKAFAERYQAALMDNGGEGDKAALAELDLFRKDVGSFVRLYDFMSQIIDYGDPELEKKQIYLRNLERMIQPDNYTAPIDLSDVVLQKVKQIDRGKTNIGLGSRIGLKGMTAAGSGEKRDPKMVAFQQVLDRLNDLFGSDEFTEAQKVSFLDALLRTLLDNAALVQQAKVNTPKQFVESPDFDDAVTGAVADNQGAHEKMSDYFFTNAPGRSHLISDIAKWFYQVVVDQDGKFGLS